MALIDSDAASAGRPRRPAFGQWPARARAWMTDRSDTSRAQRMAGAAFLIRVASAAVAYLSQVLLARWMGSHEFGIYVYVWTWALLLGGIVDLGLSAAAQRFIPEYTETRAFALLRGYLNGSRLLAFAIATAIALVGIGAIWLLRGVLDHYVVVPLFLACLVLPFYALTNVQDGIARSYNWVHLALLPPYILRPLLLIVLMVGGFLAGLPADATTAMAAAVVATWATAVVQLIIVNRRLARKVPAGEQSFAPRTWLATSFPIFMVESFYLLLTYTDVLVLQQFRAPDEIAIYYAAVKTLALVAFVYFSVSAAAAHKFTAYHVAGDREKLAAFLSESIKWTFWPSLAATVLILALGRPFLWLFGPTFVQGYHLMFILAAGLLARAAIGPVERLLNMLGEQRVCAVAYLGAFALNLGLSVTLVPRFGMTGAAVATATALVVESALLFVVTKRRLGFHVFIWRRKPL